MNSENQSNSFSEDLIDQFRFNRINLIDGYLKSTKTNQGHGPFVLLKNNSTVLDLSTNNLLGYSHPLLLKKSKSSSTEQDKLVNLINELIGSDAYKGVEINSDKEITHTLFDLFERKINLDNDATIISASGKKLTFRKSEVTCSDIYNEYLIFNFLIKAKIFEINGKVYNINKMLERDFQNVKKLTITIEDSTLHERLQEVGILSEKIGNYVNIKFPISITYEDVELVITMLKKLKRK